MIVPFYFSKTKGFTQKPNINKKQFNNVRIFIDMPI